MELEIQSGPARLSAERAGKGPAVLGLHGLTATRRYVFMGSRLLERSGRNVVLADARGHGRSTGEAAGYPELASDVVAILDQLELDRAVLAGVSMGAHTAVRVALEHPGRVTALVLITPAFDPTAAQADARPWEILASALEDGGIEGFISAYPRPAVERLPIERLLRQRMAAHERLDLVVGALRSVPRSKPFQAWAELQELSMPVLVIGSRDETDPGHPLEVAERYAENLPQAQLVVEAEGRSPLAWQGAQVSRHVLELT